VLALISGVLAALAYMQVRDMGLRGEPEYRVVFYFCHDLCGGWYGRNMAVARPSGSDQLAHHDLRGSVLLLAIGVTAVAAQMAMTRAYRLGNTAGRESAISGHRVFQYLGFTDLERSAQRPQLDRHTGDTGQWFAGQLLQLPPATGGTSLIPCDFGVKQTNCVCPRRN
jgi:hypothetical protein